MPSAERRDDRVSGSIRRVFVLIVGFSGVSWLAMNASKSGTIPL
ncbi:MAG: hypothetical protein RXS42_06885 [Nitrososphaeria archaeon]|jgi:hypothetical protein